MTDKSHKPWSAGQEAILAEGWNMGLSATVLARILGKSRNSIIGKVWRIGLPCRETKINAKSPAWRAEE